MPLTDAKLRSLKGTGKTEKFADGGGLFVLDVAAVHYDRSDHWRLKSLGVDQWAVAMEYILYSAGPVSRRSLGRMDQPLRLEARIIGGEGASPPP